MSDRPAAERREDLIALMREMQEQHECPLVASRTKLVFGAGNADADLMFVGEAPGFHEDQQGLPFVGRAGQLLDELLREIGLSRREVLITNVLKCLRYSVPVQLGDGSWERIGRLVRSQYSGEVRSVDDEGRLVPRRVVGWHATPRGDRRLFHLSYRSVKGAGKGGRVGTELTGDHPVLTERGYVPVQDLSDLDHVATGQGLSDVAFDVVCGTVLGDGSINSQSACVTFGHSEAQAEYATFKSRLLKELSPRERHLSVAAVSGGSASYPVVQVRTLAHRAIGILRRDFYRAGKRVPAWLGNDLNARMLAIWFMDDGHTRIRPPRRPSAEIAAHGFDAWDRQILVDGLERLGLRAVERKGRLHFNVDETEKLSELIAPYTPPCMRYKLHPDVEARVPYESAGWAFGAPKVLFDPVEVEDVSHRPHPDQTFFCIDVEHTNNFVTAGGVVHNCRPPDNRDPTPEEIEICSPYLHRQVALIQPRVIATLGNFATKLLTGSQRGITKVHGHPQERELGGMRVQLFPLFHPAAALRTPKVKEQLREDLAKLPALLAEPPTPAAVPKAAEPEGDPAPKPDGSEQNQMGLFG